MRTSAVALLTLLVVSGCSAGPAPGGRDGAAPAATPTSSAAGFRRSDAPGRRAECRGLTKELRGLDPQILRDPDTIISSGEGPVRVAALITDAEEMCGGPLPGVSARFPCDPSLGDPLRMPACPNDSLLTARLTGLTDRRLTLEVFHTLHSDAQGKAYAAAHDLEFPFPNDYYDAPTGDVVSLDLDPDTICTGSILSGFGASDRLMPCRRLARALRFHGFPVHVAIWRERGHVVQVSELYRP